MSPLKTCSRFNPEHTRILRVNQTSFFFKTATFQYLEIAILLQNSNMVLKNVVSWKTFEETPGLSLLSECKTLFVCLSHKFGSNVHAGLFLSRFPDSVVRIDEPNFYSLWQEEKGWATASADMVGQDSDEATEITVTVCKGAQSLCSFTVQDTYDQNLAIECV